MLVLAATSLLFLRCLASLRFASPEFLLLPIFRLCSFAKVASWSAKRGAATVLLGLNWPMGQGCLTIAPDVSCISGAVKAGVVKRPLFIGACDAFFSSARFLAWQAADLSFSPCTQLRHPGRDRGVCQANTEHGCCS